MISAVLSTTNQLELLVPPSALPDALRFPAPPVSAQRYVTYFGPPTIARKPLVTATASAVGRKVTVNATPDLAEGTPANFKWTFSDGTTVNTTTATVTKVFDVTGAVSWALEMADSYNLTAAASGNLTLTEGAPTATASAAANGMTITWGITATDPEGEVLNWTLTGTDGLTASGTVASGATATYDMTYAAGGTKSGTFTVTDSKGLAVTPAPSASWSIVAADANGWITSDDFSGSAADAAAVMARVTTAPNGGSPMAPLSSYGTVRISGGYLETLSTGNMGVTVYTIGHAKPRMVALLTGTTAAGGGAMRFYSDNGSINIEFRGDGSIKWVRNVTTPAASTSGSFSSAPAGTWANGDTLDVTYDCTTGTATVKQYRAAALLNTHSTTITKVNDTITKGALAGYINSSPYKWDNLQVGVVL